MMSSLHRIQVWNKTDGHCAYCGLALLDDNEPSRVGKYVSWMEIDHITPLKDGGDALIENLVPCCSSCNASKGRKTLEAFRYQVAKRASNRPHIPREVLDWLHDQGIVLPDVPHHQFWFEKNGLTSQFMEAAE